MVPIMNPKAMAKKPFIKFPWAKVTVAVRAKIRRENISAGPNLRASLATGRVKKTKKIIPTMPTKKEAMAEIPRAFPASPFFVMG